VEKGEVNEEEDLESLLQERNAAFEAAEDSGDELDDESTIAPPVAAKAPAKGPAKAPAKASLGPADDSAASAASAFANAFIDPTDARSRSAGPASASMRMDDVFTPRKQQQQQSKSRSSTKCKPAPPALVTTPVTTQKRSRQEDTPMHTSPYDIFRRPTNPVG
ncbi:hypothetical protein KEM55_007657, partial [Ascosphaera atra]